MRHSPRLPRRSFATSSRHLVPLLLVVLTGCGDSAPGAVNLTLSGSAVGSEGELLERQIARFEEQHPDITVHIQRTPDDATQRHQLYVQWLNARAGDPDVLQLDVVWTAEFAAAGWILPVTRFAVDIADFFPATVEANSWDGELYAVPWFVDVGMLYYRTDILERPPESLDELVSQARGGGALPMGIVWQGARYEGLVTTFLEYLGGFGGRIMTDDGRIVVDSAEAIRALSFMRDQIHLWEIAPEEVLTWHEEETRFAFQNGNALFMRNWPYASALLRDPGESRVAGRFAVAPMPGTAAGAPTAALGGAQLAINARSEHAQAAYELVRFLTAPAQMLERAEMTGQFPARVSVYADPRLGRALAVPIEQALPIIERAVPRPVTPVWTELSGILQIELHRALTRQAAPEEALRRAASGMNEVMEETGVRDLYRETTAGFGARTPARRAKG